MKKRGLFISVFALLLLGAYLGVWYYSAQWFTKESVNFTAKAKQKGITLLGPAPVIRNFPFVPEIEYTQGLSYGDKQAAFPRVVVRGFPIPFTHLTLDFPEGMTLNDGGRSLTFDTFMAKLVIPAHLPRNADYDSLLAWQQEGGKIDVLDYRLQHGPLYAEGSGHLKLDATLQPDITMDSRVKGYEAFIEEQIEARRIERFPGAMATMVLNSMAATDPETGEREVRLDITIKDQRLSFGPVQSIPLPPIVWDRHTPPAPHQ